MTYEFQALSLPLVISFLLLLVTGIAVVVRNPKSKINLQCGILLFSGFVWLFGKVMIVSSSDRASAEMWSFISWFGAVFIASSMIHFAVLFTKFIPSKWDPYLLLLHIPSLLIYPFIVMEGVEWQSVAGVWDIYKDGLMFKIYSIYLFLSLLASLVLLWRDYSITKNMVEKSQIKLIAVGLTIAGVGTATTEVFLPAFNVHLPPIGGVFTSIMGICVGWAIIKYKMFHIKHVVEKPKEKVESNRLDPGFSYMIKEKGSQNSYEIFRGLVSQTPGLCITSFYPEKLRNEYNLKKTPIVWITETKTEEKTLSPYRLEFEMLYTLETFMKDSESSTVIIDDIKYLSMMNGFDKTMEFLKSVNDLASMHEATVIVPLNAERFEERETSQIRSLFDETLDLVHDASDVSISDNMQSYSFIFEEEEPVNASKLLGRLEGKAMCISSTFPSKLMKRYDLPTMDTYWLTKTKKTKMNTLNPSRLDFEVMHTIGEFLRNEGGTVFIHGLDNLLMENGLAKTNDFLKTIIDIASVTDGTIVVSVNPKTVKIREMAVLEGRFDVVKK